MITNSKALLVLEDGRRFMGHRLGSEGEISGEVCFNTGLTGYQEVLTDPSYCGQIVTMTYPHIGNYGINSEDVESTKIQVAGFIIREESLMYSNHRATKSLGDYLKKYNIVGIQGIDTRALTRHIRSKGAMNGIISTLDLDTDSLIKKLKNTPSMNGLDLVERVMCKSQYSWGKKKKLFTSDTPNYRVAVLDFGVKRNILRLLELEGCEMTIFPATSSIGKIVSAKPDGLFLSNGPGDPSAVVYGIRMVKELLGSIPIFGICLGHQILTLALGGETFKLKFGHRGINHPVMNLKSEKVEITSQNHGFAVDPESLPNNVEITHVNLNDQTVEGINCMDIPAFSVQYHPEASPGPHDSRYLFASFIKLMKEHKN